MNMALQLRVAGFTPEVGSNVLLITVGFQLQLWGSIILAKRPAVSIGP